MREGRLISGLSYEQDQVKRLFHLLPSASWNAMSSGGSSRNYIELRFTFGPDESRKRSHDHNNGSGLLSVRWLLDNKHYQNYDW